MSSVSSTTGFNLVRNFFKESFGDSYQRFVTLMKTHHQGEVRSGLAVECYNKLHQSSLTFDTNRHFFFSMWRWRRLFHDEHHLTPHDSRGWGTVKNKRIFWEKAMAYFEFCDVGQGIPSHEQDRKGVHATCFSCCHYIRSPSAVFVAVAPTFIDSQFDKIVYSPGLLTALLLLSIKTYNRCDLPLWHRPLLGDESRTWLESQQLEKLAAV